MPFPFEVPFKIVQADLDTYVDSIFSCLQSEFITLPKGPGFIEYPIFEQGYEALKKATGGFRNLSAELVLKTVYETPVSFIVLRTILGFTPPEWAYVAEERKGVEITQGAIRTLDRKVRMEPQSPLRGNGTITSDRIRALIETACDLLKEGVSATPSDKLHRLDKADTKSGLVSLHPLVDMGVPYAMLLYERFLGRPFAGHRDSVSELVGDVLETAIESMLSKNGVSFRKTKRAERVQGFDQAPDFIIPDEFNPRIVIEAKITEDDGTARDKVTRVQHLGSLSQKKDGKGYRFEVIACIAGRGFKVRREDMKKLILAARGKVFTLRNMDRLIECTYLKEFKTR